ncbi:MAG: hypothetical protein ACJ75J_06615 [Cytophagaceae bacterium]
MNKFVKKGIKNLTIIKKDAIIYSKDVYNDFAKPLVRTISRRIAKIDFNGIYKDGVKTANIAVNAVRGFGKRSNKLIKINAVKIVSAPIVKTAKKTAIVKFRKAQKFVAKRVPVVTAAAVAFAAGNFLKAQQYVLKTYPKVEKFVKSNYPSVQSWVSTQLPKIEAFLAGQLSARVQKFAA